MEWLSTTLNWYFYLLLLGAIFFPLTSKIFSSFFDFGYPFAKTVAILFISYLVFFLGLIKLVSFTQLNLFLIITLIIIINLLIFSKKRINIKAPLLILIFEEGLFLFSLIFLAFVRGQEPSIRGLEKFMDFGFINSILRSKYFPPLDMWLSSDLQTPQGYPINYYYFGHLTGAFLIKLTSVKPAIGYNLILATIFAQAITLSFSLAANIVYLFLKNLNNTVNYFKIISYGLLGSFIVNLGGNLHTIYIFTKGYPNENPIPFWRIFSTYNPSHYWYPNATRFIPFTIHEFPVYSYVVADLHGHVFDIPFVLLTLSLLLIFFLHYKKIPLLWQKIKAEKKLVKNLKQLLAISNQYQFLIVITVFFGLMTATHYMTNAFDGPIYLLLTLIFFFSIYKNSVDFLIYSALLIFCFMIFSLPFSLNFSPFVSGIGVNCSPNFLINLKKFGPFLFEKGNCQLSPFWMLFTLWGFFWVNFLFFLAIKKKHQQLNNLMINKLDNFILILFSFSTFLLIIPEFFYIKDIYPAHFRANTMFKLGYQAFIMMGFASTYTFFRMNFIQPVLKFIFRSVFLFLFFFLAIYPFFAFPSYYGQLNRPVELDGSLWLNNVYPADKEIIDYLNNNISGQPVILEAQGDSYTDFERISAYTGLPTVAGWWVHEWLWRGSSDVVGEKIPDIVNLYESKDIELTKNLIKQYQIKYIIVSTMEKEKYKNLNEEKFKQIANPVFISSDKNGVIYQINQTSY